MLCSTQRSAILSRGRTVAVKAVARPNGLKAVRQVATNVAAVSIPATDRFARKPVSA